MDFNPSDFDLDAIALLKAKKRREDGSLTPLDPPRENQLRELIEFAVDEMLDSSDDWQNILIVCRTTGDGRYPVIHTEEQIRALHQRIGDEKDSTEPENGSDEALDGMSADAEREEPQEGES